MIQGHNALMRTGRHAMPVNSLLFTLLSGRRALADNYPVRGSIFSRRERRGSQRRGSQGDLTRNYGSTSILFGSNTVIVVFW